MGSRILACRNSVIHTRVKDNPVYRKKENHRMVTDMNNRYPVSGKYIPVLRNRVMDTDSLVTRKRVIHRVLDMCNPTPALDKGRLAKHKSGWGNWVKYNRFRVSGKHKKAMGSHKTVLYIRFRGLDINMMDLCKTANNILRVSGKHNLAKYTRCPVLDMYKMGLHKKVYYRACNRKAMCNHCPDSGSDSLA